MVAVTFNGRIVWGDPTKSRPVLDDNTRQPKLNKNNQPRNQWAFGVAISKTAYTTEADENGQTLANALALAAGEMFPQGTAPSFAWKITDGDGVDKNGQPFASREGYAGCMVLAVTTEAFAPKIVAHDGVQWSDTQDIKCGDYVRVGIDAKPHAGQTPGLYIDPTVIGRTGYGEPIFNGPDANTVLGAAPAALPAGASAAPIAAPGMPTGAPAHMPGTGPGTMNPATGAMVPGAVAQPAGVPGMVPAVAATVPAGGPAMPGMQPAAVVPAATTVSPGNVPGMVPQPAHDFVANAGQPAAQPGVVAPGMVPGT